LHLEKKTISTGKAKWVFRIDATTYVWKFFGVFPANITDNDQKCLSYSKWNGFGWSNREEFYGPDKPYQSISSPYVSSGYKVGDIITISLDCDGKQLNYECGKYERKIPLPDNPAGWKMHVNMFTQGNDATLIEFRTID